MWRENTVLYRKTKPMLKLKTCSDLKLVNYGKLISVSAEQNSPTEMWTEFDKI